MKQQGTFSIHDCFAGKGVFLTGSTGFLAKAVVEKILRDLPDIGQVYLLIRARVKPDGSRVDPRERLREEILRNSAFGRLREQLGEDFERFCESKITCVPGDLTSPRLGLDEAAFSDLAGKVHFVINSAATVVFDERLDWALDLNALGPQRLLELAKAANCPYVHISTAYVSGMRTGLVPEQVLDPLAAIDAQLPKGVPRPAKFEVNEEIARLQRLVEDITGDWRKLCEKKRLAPDGEEAAAKLRQALVSAGMRRAQSLGWNDTYTYTKFLGEQLVKLNHQPVAAVVVRPAIIESSLSEPEPGWLDGLRMADPIIIGFGKGRLPDFPADQNVVLDIIPADLVVNGILAASAYISARPGSFDLFAIASSSENPLLFRSLYDYVRDYFQKHPMTDRAGRPVAVPAWRFPTVAQYRSRLRNRYLLPLRAAHAILDGPFPLPGTRKVRTRLRNLNSKLEQLLYYVDIYGPYVTLDCRFETAHARELLEMLAPRERAQFDFDPRKIRWKNYIQDVHIPGLKRNILRMNVVPRTGAGEGHLLDEEGEAIRKRRGAAAQAIRGVPQTVVDLCGRGHQRFGGKSLVEIRRAAPGGGASARHVRITYDAMFERSGQLARLLLARLGLRPGDRIALLGENCPEWALAYLAISRACCTAVPLDRALPPREAAQLIKFVEAKAAILSPLAFDSFTRELGPGAGLPPCLDMLADVAPHPGQAWRYPEASLGDRPLKEPAPETLASILFTSGTTKEPKGVMLSHANLLADALSVAEVLEPLESDRFLSVLPLHHALEFTGGFLIPMYGGSTIHHVERIQDVSDTLKLAGISVIVGVPRLFQLFMARIRTRLMGAGLAKRLQAGLGHAMAGAWELAFSSSVRKRLFREVHAGLGGHLRLLVSGGAALDPEVFHFFRSFGITIVEGYGLTETSPVLTVNPQAAPKAGSVGPPIPGVEIRIGNPDYSGIGEVLARGPTVMQGYWRNPAATAGAFEGGWFKTGDLGRLGPDGYLHLTGRLKDVIVTAAGKNVHPDEIETALRDIKGVKELCVLGLPARSGRGEEVAAVIVPEAQADPAGIRAGIERTLKSLPSYQRIARLEFQEEDLPKTTTLKVQRAKVRARYSRPASALLPRPAREITAPAASESKFEAESGVLVEVARAVAEVAELPGGIKPAEVTPELRLQLDLGIDSIGRVDLLQKLELRLNLTISHEAESRLFTVQDVMAAVESSRQAGAAAGGKRRGKGILARRADHQEVRAELQDSLSRSILQGIFSTTASVLMNTYLRIECQGLQHIPDSGAYILAANHCSHLDAVAIREVLGRRAADLYVMGAKDYFFDTRLKSWFFTTFLNALPFDREDTAAQSLATCRTVLDAGRAILIFPEGTRSITGELQAFKPGIGVLGIELDVPVVPVHLHGTFEALPKGRSLPRPARIHVRIGPPLRFEALKKERGAMPPTDLYRGAAAELRARVEALAQQQA